MSKYKQIVKLTEEGLTPKEIAKKIKAKINYIYFVRNKVKKAGKKKPSKIIKAVQTTTADIVKSPPHYKTGGFETIDFIEAKDLNYRLGNVVKYVSRAGKKLDSDPLVDLKKARWYLDREIFVREGA
jgi:transposase